MVAMDKIIVTMKWNIPQKEPLEKIMGYTAHTPPPAFSRKYTKMRCKKISGIWYPMRIWYPVNDYTIW